ncbi:hypothetical protein [Bacillus sp. SD088]|uniref:hypothetical protein n=1 Tax=Bacillus sp. SD088 TaxID=2782012 RepID=UPI001A961083|nr:hypothetical protein [Bacillus sp. SD088]MBO0992879.1 hypothetical protein [Bacillus sp. SD088]
MRSFSKKEQSSVVGDELTSTMDSFSKTMRLVAGALLGSLAFILQSAGVFAGVGYILSILSTGPLVLASILSLRLGVMTYFVTIFLLAMFQPSELFVFPCTTGLLGLSLGMGLKCLKRSVLIVTFSALCLTIGISILLYGIKFPILGPAITAQFSSVVIFGVFAFSLLYSWIWQILSTSAIKLLNKILSRRSF